MTTFEWKLLILNRIIALRRFAEPFQNPSNHFKNARPHLWTASAPSCFRPFIEHLATSSLSPKTIRKHVDNLWMLGGEIIRDLNHDPSLRKVTADRLLRGAVHADGGPLIHNGSEEEQLSLDSTCRKLHRFLSQPER